MRDFLEAMVKLLVDNPEAAVVTEEETDEAVYLKISVAEEDMGRIIGRDGKIAKAIRSIIRAGGRNLGKQIYVDII